MKILVLIIGIAFLALGVAGFVPGLAVDDVLFGVFPVTMPLSIAFIVTGAIGIMIGMSHRRALTPPMATGGHDLRDI